MSEHMVGQIDWSQDYESAKQKLSESEFRAVVLENKTLASVRADRDKAFRGLQAARDRIEELESQVSRLRGQLEEAIEDIEEWGAYADEYFRDKWNFENRLAKHRAALTEETP